MAGAQKPRKRHQKKSKQKRGPTFFIPQYAKHLMAKKTANLKEIHDSWKALCKGEKSKLADEAMELCNRPDEELTDN